MDENLKVLGINGSPRKKNTYKMIEMVMEGITQPGIEKEIITLSDYKNLKYCLGDCTCLFVPPGTCVQKDDVPAIQQKITEADAYVLGSPVYIMQVSGQLKTLIDRCCSMAHRPPAIGKYAVVVSPIAAPAEAAKSTIDYMKSWMKLLGARVIGELAAYAPHIGIDNEDEVRKKAHELGAKLGSDLVDKKIYPPTEEDIRMFNAIKNKVKQIGGPDLEYWKTHEWLDKKYFYEH
jgi:multimeric flavodoxin WrbA